MAILTGIFYGAALWAVLRFGAAGFYTIEPQAAFDQWLAGGGR